jgi:hypothetical protein
MVINFTMPSTFPDSEFRSFGIVAARFFPDLLSDEALYDPLEIRRYFDWSWQAVRYRYRSCVECSEEFKTLLDNPSLAVGLGRRGADLQTGALHLCVLPKCPVGLR